MDSLSCNNPGLKEDIWLLSSPISHIDAQLQVFGLEDLWSKVEALSRSHPSVFFQHLLGGTHVHLSYYQPGMWTNPAEKEQRSTAKYGNWRTSKKKKKKKNRERNNSNISSFENVCLKEVRRLNDFSTATFPSVLKFRGTHGSNYTVYLADGQLKGELWFTSEELAYFRLFFFSNSQSLPLIRWFLRVRPYLFGSWPHSESSPVVHSK